MRNWKKIVASAFALFALADLPAHASAIGEIEVRQSTKATYVACTGSFTCAASATDVWQLYAGSNKVVRVLKVGVINHSSGTAVVAWDNVSLIKRSTANSGGTAVTNTIVPLDANFAAADAVSKHYTANPTTGTTVGTITQFPALGTLETGAYPSSATGVNTPIRWLFDANIYGPIILRGTSQGIVVNLNSTTQAGTTPKFLVVCIWTEE